MNHTSDKVNPWTWIPTLYFAQGLPYVAVMTISVIMYKRLGISNTDIALYTGWLYLPWVIKPFWSPFVDLLKTKRWWIIMMQFILSIGLAAIALALPTTLFFKLTLAIFWIIGFTSATHDIAADGYYMLALNEHKQSFYVGIRSTFYRISTVAGQGLLVILAGLIEMNTGLPPAQLQIVASPNFSNEITLPTFQYQKNDPSAEDAFIFTSSLINIGTKIDANNADEALQRISAIEQEISASNRSNGFTTETSSIKSQSNGSKTEKANIITKWLQRNFGEKRDATEGTIDNAVVVGITLTQAPENDEPRILNITFKEGDQSIRLEQSKLDTRFVFNKDNWNKTAYLLFRADHKLKKETHAIFEGTSGNIPFAWLTVFLTLSLFFLIITLYHNHILPRPASDRANNDVTASNLMRQFLGTFKSFFMKKQAFVAILFMLLYRLPEAQLVKLINPFLLDPADKGGLGLTTGEVGFVYGTIGIIGLTLGGIIGGVVAAKGGLKRWLWPMAWSMSLTCLTFVYLSYAEAPSLLIINVCVFIEQFGYGFGFTAYMLFLIYFSEGEHRTAHYAICTGFMALGMMLPGMAAGWLQETIGYRHFFIWTIICCIATIGVCSFIKIDAEFGRKEK